MSAGYSEISEKKTSKLGYLILIALFIFLIVIGQTVFKDIKDIPERPKQPAFCVPSYVERIDNIRYAPACVFSDIDYDFGIPMMINKLDPHMRNLITYRDRIDQKQRELVAERVKLNRFLTQYDISLQEAMAGEEAIIDKPEVKVQVTELMNTTEDLELQIQILRAKKNTIITKTLPARIQLNQTYENARDHYKTQTAFFDFKVFLLELLFILPFFIIFLYLYLRYKKKDSPYTIIITSIFFASTILLLQVVLTLLYCIIPKEILERIFTFLMEFIFLKYVVYYVSVIIVILLLGGIVYYIQKKVYDPKRVALRHLKDSKCPKCSFTLSLSELFCPKCGRQIKTKCKHCKKLKFKDLPRCPSCGKGG